MCKHYNHRVVTNHPALEMNTGMFICKDCQLKKVVFTGKLSFITK